MMRKSCFSGTFIQCSLIQTLILVQISVFIDRLCVALRYMNSYLTLLMSNINIRNKLQLFKKINAFPVYSICSNETVNGKWCLDKSVGQAENDLERSFVKQWRNSV